MQTSSEAKSSPLEPIPRPTAKKLVTVQIIWLRIIGIKSIPTW